MPSEAVSTSPFVRSRQFHSDLSPMSSSQRSLTIWTRRHKIYCARVPLICGCRGPSKRPAAGQFDPQEVTRGYGELVKQYRIGSVGGDSYASEWVRTAWSKAGVSYVRSELPKSQIYLECAPLFARGLVRLPDHPKLLRELRLLERHTHRSGRDSVDHPRGERDDFANSCCGVLRSLSNALSVYTAMDWVVADVDRAPETAPSASSSCSIPKRRPPRHRRRGPDARTRSKID